MINSEEVAKKIIEIDKEFYECLKRFNELKNRREKILQFAEKNEISEELKVEMKKNIEDFDEVLLLMKELEKQTTELKKLI